MFILSVILFWNGLVWTCLTNNTYLQHGILSLSTPHKRTQLTNLNPIKP